MKRTAYKKLVNWKTNKHRKPLIIRGARQVGKTWLMKEFARNEYKSVAYINFEDKIQLQHLFEQDFSIDRILLALEVETGVKAKPNETLIIFDEIQEAGRGITVLKYFHELAPEYHIMVAGSYLGISLQQSSSFPVGKVDFLNLEPLSFIEFLMALKQDKLIELIKIRDWGLIKTFKSKYIELLKQYYFIGGMPEVVNSFCTDKDFDYARKIQENILLSYENDFAKHAPNNIIPRIRMAWESIPSQLAKENKKFIFRIIKQGARAKDFELAIEWLWGSGLITKVKRVTKPGLPLKAYEDSHAFKIFLLDVGLLGALSGLEKSAILKGNTIFEEFKGAITEQYVCQQLQKNNLYYWSAEKSTGEIDFLLQHKGSAIPIEVKSEENLKAKSLKAFVEKYKSKTAIRTSMSDFREEDWLINIPLYCIHPDFLSKI